MTEFQINEIIMCWWMSLMRKDTLSITVLPPTEIRNNSYLVNNKAVSCGNSCVCFKRQNSSNILEAETPAKRKLNYWRGHIIKI